MDKDIAQALYMNACLDAKRNIVISDPARLVAAFCTVNADVSFEEWCARMGDTAEPQPQELSDEEKAEHNQEVFDKLAAEGVIKKAP